MSNTSTPSTFNLTRIDRLIERIENVADTHPPLESFLAFQPDETIATWTRYRDAMLERHPDEADKLTKLIEKFSPRWGLFDRLRIPDIDGSRLHPKPFATEYERRMLSGWSDNLNDIASRREYICEFRVPSGDERRLAPTTNKLNELAAVVFSEIGRRERPSREPIFELLFRIVESGPRWESDPSEPWMWRKASEQSTCWLVRVPNLFQATANWLRNRKFVSKSESQQDRAIGEPLASSHDSLSADSPLPTWDAESRVLRVGPWEKEFEAQATKVVRILNAFQAKGWPKSVKVEACDVNTSIKRDLNDACVGAPIIFDKSGLTMTWHWRQAELQQTPTNSNKLRSRTPSLRRR